jgi:hypothetical protein
MGRANAESFIGDLEERFHRICSRMGVRRATIWFYLQFLVSLPSIMIETFRPKQLPPPVAINLALSDSFVMEDSIAASVGDACRSDGLCYGTILWKFDDGSGSEAGQCNSCNAFHVRCGTCGEIGVYDETHTILCDRCGAFWLLEMEEWEAVGFEMVAPGLE